MVLAITKDKQLKKKCPWQVQALKKNNTVALIHFDKVLQEKKSCLLVGAPSPILLCEAYIPTLYYVNNNYYMLAKSEF